MLTDEQRKMVEDNLPLATHTIRKYFPNHGRLPISVEDIKGIAYYALCKAAETFNPDMGYAFSTHACRVVRCEISHEIRKLNQDSRKVIFYSVSIDGSSGSKFDREPKRAYQYMPENKPVVDEAVLRKVCLDNAFSKIRSMPHGDLLLAAMTKQIKHKDAGDLMGISRQALEHKLKRCKKIVKEAIAE